MSRLGTLLDRCDSFLRTWDDWQLVAQTEHILSATEVWMSAGEAWGALDDFCREYEKVFPDGRMCLLSASQETSDGLGPLDTLRQFVWVVKPLVRPDDRGAIDPFRIRIVPAERVELVARAAERLRRFDLIPDGTGADVRYKLTLRHVEEFTPDAEHVAILDAALAVGGPQRRWLTRREIERELRGKVPSLTERLALLAKHGFLETKTDRREKGRPGGTRLTSKGAELVNSSRKQKPGRKR